MSHEVRTFAYGAIWALPVLPSNTACATLRAGILLASALRDFTHNLSGNYFPKNSE